MTQKFKDGQAIPVTVLQAGPCVISQVKSTDKDGYNAIQLGFDKSNKLSKSESGHQKDVKNGESYWKTLREFRVDNAPEVKVGDMVKVSTFQEGEKVKVQGISKGKGFAGVVKRHGFSGGNKTHGNKDQLRMPGSIGAQEPQHVFKGKRMAGRMGADVVTVKNLEVVGLDEEKNELYVRGAVPGRYNTLIRIMADGDLVVSAPQEEPVRQAQSDSDVESKSDEKKEEVKVEEKPADEPAKEEKKESSSAKATDDKDAKKGEAVANEEKNEKAPEVKADESK